MNNRTEQRSNRTNNDTDRRSSSRYCTRRLSADVGSNIRQRSIILGTPSLRWQERVELNTNQRHT